MKKKTKWFFGKPKKADNDNDNENDNGNDSENDIDRGNEDDKEINTNSSPLRGGGIISASSSSAKKEFLKNFSKMRRSETECYCQTEDDMVYYWQ